MYTNALFTLFGQEVQLYGICIAVGILACILVFFLYATKGKMSSVVKDFVFYTAIISIAIGFGFAALSQAFVNLIYKGVFEFTGITVMGGLLGGAGTFLFVYFFVGKYYFKKEKAGLHKKEFNTVFNIAPSCITIAHSFGRVGCLMAGCCYGLESSTGFTIFNSGAYRIPVQLYEAIFLFALFIVLSILYFKRFNYTMHVYLISYAIWRFVIEFYRGDIVRGSWWGLANSQWMSILFLLLGVALTIYHIIRKRPFFLPKIEEQKKAVSNEDNLNN